MRGKFERISEPLSNTIRDTADTARTPFWFSDVRPKRSTDPACNVNSPVYAGVAFESTFTFKPFATLVLILPDGTFPLFQLDGLFQLSFLPPFGALVIVAARGKELEALTPWRRCTIGLAPCWVNAQPLIGAREFPVDCLPLRPPTWGRGPCAPYRSTRLSC